MADIEIVRESADGFTHQGHSVSYTDAYIKVRRSFLNEALRTLKGSPLSVFLAVCLSLEAPDDDTICSLTGFHTWSVQKALDYLIKHHFIEELPRVGSNGHKLYRPIRYAWSGSDKNAPPEPRNGEFTFRPARIARHDDLNDDLLIDHSESSFIHETRKIFLECGIQGTNLDRLARSVQPEVAQAWAEWLRVVNRTIWHTPEGNCVKKLLADPTARPPFSKLPGPAPRVRKPGKLAPLFALENEEDPADDEPA
jgi:hypothetical protein